MSNRNARFSNFNGVASPGGNARTLIVACCYIGFVGCIMSTIALWMWLWRSTSYHESFVIKATSGFMIVSAFLLFTHLRKGFASFFVILALTGLIASFTSILDNLPAAYGSRPYIPALALCCFGLIIVLFNTSSFLGSILLLTATICIAGMFCFIPFLISPMGFAAIGSVFMASACFARYIVLLNTYY